MPDKKNEPIPDKDIPKNILPGLEPITESSVPDFEYTPPPPPPTPDLEEGNSGKE